MMQASSELRRLNYYLGQCSSVYHEISLAAGLSDAQSNIFYTLVCTEKQLCQRDLCILTGLPKQTVHSAIHALVTEGCVELRPGDGRRQLIHLTEKGQRFGEEKIFPVIAVENRALAAMGPEAEQLMRLMDQFAEHLRKEYENQ